MFRRVFIAACALAALSVPAAAEDWPTKQIKVVIITGIADERVQHLCLALGADGYEVKPFDDQFIRRVVKLAQDEVGHHAA